MVDADTGEREKMLLFSVIASVFARWKSTRDL
jgi:hypothetical protein